MASLLSFLDIETVPAKKSYDDLDSRGQLLWDKFQERFIKEGWYENKKQAYNKKAALYSDWGKIICISVGYYNDDEIEINTYTSDEMETGEAWLLNEFVEDFEKIQRPIRWCGHNIKKFDIPYICQRLIVNGIEPREFYFIDRAGVKPWENKDIDTMTLWTQGVFGQTISLDRLCYVLGVPSPKGELDGSKVRDCYYGEDGWENLDFAERIERIAGYCDEDIKCLPSILAKFGLLK